MMNIKVEDRKYDLEERLINFAIKIISVSDNIDKTIAGKNLANQIARSGTSSALNYGEALAAESRKDFIHKIKIVLKELKETIICLKIIIKKPLIQLNINNTLSECKELIAIFTTSIKTAKSRLE